MKKTLYLNVEDDVTKIANKVKAQEADQIVLVIPKNSYLFADIINLRLLKKQVDLLGKEVAILTMDEKGQSYATAAGFALQHLPRVKKSNSLSDVRIAPPLEKPAAVIVDKPEVASKPRVKKVRAQAESRLQKKPKPREQVTTVAPSVSTARVLKDRTRSFSPTISDDSTRVSNIKRQAEITPEKLDNVYIPAADKSGKAPQRKSFKRWVFGFVVIGLIVVLVLGLIVLPSATITVQADSQTVSRDLDILVDSSLQSPDAARLSLPATKIDETRPASRSFTVNGKKEIGSRAEGRVALYNLTGSALTLRASTTVLTVGSKNYLFKQDQPNVAALSSAQNDGNATVADIVAQEGGEDYNLPAGTRVEITNQAFGSQPQRLYAKTISQVIGGSSRFVSVVTQEDITASQQALTQSVVEEINNGLSDTQKLVNGAYTVDVQEYASDQPLDSEATNFTASANIAVRGLAFDEQALKDMIRQRLLQTIGKDKLLQEPVLDSIVYKINNLNLETGIMELIIHYESKALPVIDRRALLPDLVGKSQQEASDLILTNPHVSSVEIDLRPFWQSALPRFSNKIELIVKNSN